MVSHRIQWVTAKAALAVLISCISASPAAGASAIAANWTVEPVATPVGAQHVALQAVSCAEATTCMGVGYSEGSTPGAIPLAEMWNGTRWSLSGAVIALPDSHLLGISCPLANWCAAVGSDGHVGFAETWNGTMWTAYTITAPPSSQSFTLLGISCTSPSHCLAVGYYVDDTGGYGKALVEEWNGSTWTEGNAVDPNPRGTPYDANSSLYAISCASPTSCVAVGEYEDEPDGTNPALAESWNGSTWTVDASPTIPNAFQTYLNSVSCWAPGACVAVGGYNTLGSPSPEGNTVSEIWDGSAWHQQSAPVLPETFNDLHGVSCTSATFCISLGSGSPGANYIALWNGAWAYEAFNANLDSVSCTSAAYCVATGAEDTAVYTWHTAAPPTSAVGSPAPTSPSPTSRPGVYVALGDSYSSGQSNPPYLLGTDTDADQCHRSALAYAFDTSLNLGFYKPDFSFHACNGAAIKDFFHSYMHEPPQLSWLSGADALVTLTIGGNDASFAKVMASCVLGRGCERHWEKQINQAIFTMGYYSPSNHESLQRLYMIIAKDAPNAKIIVVGYPRFFPVRPPEHCISALGPTINKAKMLWINSEIKRMDTTIESSVDAAHRVYPHVVYAIGSYNAFVHHELCTASPDMYGVKISTSEKTRGESFHPNIYGHQALARLVEKAYR